MSLKDYRKTRHLNCFSKVDTLGSFDFFNYIVFLESIQPADMIEAAKSSLAAKGGVMSVEQLHAKDKVFSLAIHEYTHFVDSSSTLWGLRYMQLLDTGYQAHGHSGGVAAFPPAKQLDDFGRSIRWPDYYTEKFPDGDPSLRPWSWTITGGRVFDGQGRPSARPIIFVRFGDNMGRAIVRSPLSTVSVLEASAYSQELGYLMGSSSQLRADERTVELRHMSDKTLDYIYHQDLTEYSVCAHLFAVLQQCTDIGVAYRCVGVLTRWVLNMPVAALPIILGRLGTTLQEVNGWTPESQPTELVREALLRHDLGALYYLLVICLPPSSYASSSQLEAGLAASLDRLGLGLDKVKVMADTEATQAADALSASPIKQICSIADAGLRNYKAISWEAGMLPWQSLHLPKAMLGDLSFTHIFDAPDNVLRDYDVEKSYEDLFVHERWVRSFAQACF